MRLAVISDLHLGRGDLADAFGHEDGEFVRFLKWLERHFEKIVLLGDIFDVLTAPRFGSQRAEFQQIRRAHPELVARLLSPPYIYVHGNHDRAAQQVFAAPQEMVVEDHGVRILFTHGHHFDWIIHRVRHLSDASVWLGGWMRRLGWNAIYRFGYELDMRLRMGRERGLASKFQQWAVALAAARHADVVVTAHTHWPCVRTIGSRMYLNSGACFEGRFEFLQLNTQSATFELGKGRP